MIPGEFNMKIHRGSTFEHTLDAKIADIPVIFGTEYTSAELHIRPAWVKNAGSAAPLLSLTTANGGITFDTLDGVVKLLKMHISAADTAALAFDSGKYDLELINSTPDPDVVDKLIFGSVTVVGEKTV
jgi:hypothetical protein